MVSLNRENYTIRKFCVSDIPSIVSLLNLVFKPTIPLSEDWWVWKYAKNPAGFYGNQGSIWVAEDKGKIVGHYAVIPYKVKVGDATVLAGQSVDTAVHPEYRRMGIFEALAEKVYYDIRDLYSFLYGFPSNMAYQGFLKLGWTEHFINEISRFNNYDRPINEIFSNCFYATAGKTFLKSLRIKSSLIRDSNSKSGERVVFEKINGFGSEFDKFWEIKRDYEQVIVERTSSYLNWRFAKPFGSYSTWAGRSAKDGRILGYLVTRITSHKIKNVLSIVDLCAMPHEHRFIQAAIDLCSKENGADLIVIRVPATNEFSKTFFKNGFIALNKYLRRFGMYQPPLILYAFEGHSKAPRIQDWSYSLADTDYG